MDDLPEDGARVSRSVPPSYLSFIIAGILDDARISVSANRYRCRTVRDERFHHECRIIVD